MILLKALGAAAKSAPSSGLGETVGITLFGVAILMIWRSTHLRASNNKELRQQVKLAQAGLSDVAVDALSKFKSEIENILPIPSTAVEPGQFIIDPLKLEVRAHEVEILLKRLKQLNVNFEKFLNICTYLFYLSLLWTFCYLLLIGTYYLEYSHFSLWHSVGLIFILITCVGVFLFFGGYVYLWFWIQKTIEVSTPLENPGRI